MLENFYVLWYKALSNEVCNFFIAFMKFELHFIATCILILQLLCKIYLSNMNI